MPECMHQVLIEITQQTCEGYPGTRDHEETDAKMLADWNVDYIKVDGCNIDRKDMVAGYTRFGKAMNETGRPIV
jgi:Alpha galactosidase A